MAKEQSATLCALSRGGLLPSALLTVWPMSVVNLLLASQAALLGRPSTFTEHQRDH